MDRLDVELYAERLSRHAARAADDLADARLRLAWCELERDVRQVLAATDVERLRRLGVLTDAGRDDVVAGNVIERSEDLAAIARLQSLVERRRADGCQTGVTARSRPPSSS